MKNGMVRGLSLDNDPDRKVSKLELMALVDGENVDRRHGYIGSKCYGLARGPGKQEEISEQRDEWRDEDEYWDMREYEQECRANRAPYL
jgi:hypothetical protein